MCELGTNMAACLAIRELVGACLGLKSNWANNRKLLQELASSKWHTNKLANHIRDNATFLTSTVITPIPSVRDRKGHCLM